MAITRRSTSGPHQVHKRTMKRPAPLEHRRETSRSSSQQAKGHFRSREGQWFWSSGCRPQRPWQNLYDCPVTANHGSGDVVKLPQEPALRVVVTKAIVVPWVSRLAPARKEGGVRALRIVRRPPRSMDGASTAHPAPSKTLPPTVSPDSWSQPGSQPLRTPLARHGRGCAAAPDQPGAADAYTLTGTAVGCLGVKRSGPDRE